jgi:hypothetical protein
MSEIDGFRPMHEAFTGFGGGHGMHRPQHTGHRRHGNDAYTKAVSDERDELLNSRLKSICRGY